MLRKRIQELQHYRRMGLTSAADIEKYEADAAKRVRAMPMSVDHSTNRGHLGSGESERGYQGLPSRGKAQSQDG